MRKRNKNIWAKTRKNIFLWIGLILLLILFTLFPYQLKIRGITQDISVNIGKLWNEKKVTLTSYQEELIKNLRKENETLRSLLEYKKSLVDYNVIAASVIFRENVLSNTLTIDKGKKDGITKNMAVVTEIGLIGRVVEVYQNSSLIRLLTDTTVSNKVAISCINNKEELHGVLESFDKGNNTFKVTILENRRDIEIGSKVITSGLGGIFPEGILVGTVSSITTDELEISVLIKVKPAVDFNKLGYVFILEK